MKIKKGDQVIIVKGKDKGKKAKVLRGFPKKSHILIEGVNIKKVHRKPKREREKGQVVEVASSLDVSKVKLICPKCGKPTRIGYKISKRKKYRVCKKCGEEI